MKKLSRQKWFRLVLTGSFMIFLSAVIGAGLFYSIVYSELSLPYTVLLGFGSASSLATGVLMFFDAGHYKIRDEVKKLSSDGVIMTEEETKEYINSLQQNCERLRPETLSKDYE
jgi:hypothetical protein